jgi:2-isopropylmalate synthase
MALHTRRQLFGVRTRVNTRELARTSRLVSTCTGIAVPPNKAVVGANAFAHEAGIHQDGVLKHRLTYEIMSAETVGLDGNALVLGKHSGRHAVRKRLEDLGHHLGDDELAHVFAQFKAIADKKKVVDDRDLEALVASESLRPPAIFELVQVQVSCGTHAIPTATVRMRASDGALRTESAQGDGPVHAVCQAIDRIVGAPVELVEYSTKAITEGIDAVGEVTIRLRPLAAPAPASEPPRRRVFTGHGVNVDVLVATAEAYTTALNKLLAATAHAVPAPSASPALAELASRTEGS